MADPHRALVPSSSALVFRSFVRLAACRRSQSIKFLLAKNPARTRGKIGIRAGRKIFIVIGRHIVVFCVQQSVSARIKINENDRKNNQKNSGAVSRRMSGRIRRGLGRLEKIRKQGDLYSDLSSDPSAQRN